MGQYSTQRYGAYYLGEKMMASLSFDTGTHPEYRRQGIFKTIGDHHFKEEGKQNINFSTGFPNENFWPGGKKFNWHALCPIPLLENQQVSNIHVGKTSKFDLLEIKKFDDEFKGFSESFKHEIPIYLNRTQRYLNWRFVEKPNLKNRNYEYLKFKILDKSGELIAFIVTKFFQSDEHTILHLVDYLAPNDADIFQFIFNFLIETAKTHKINTISMFLNRYQPLSEYLRKFGFTYVDTKRVFIIRTNNDLLDRETLFEEKNHYMTMGDSDVI